MVVYSDRRVADGKSGDANCGNGAKIKATDHTRTSNASVVGQFQSGTTKPVNAILDFFLVVGKFVWRICRQNKNEKWGRG